MLLFFQQKNSNDTMKFLPRNFQLLDVQAPSEEVRLLIEHVFKFKQSYFESVSLGQAKMKCNNFQF